MSPSSKNANGRTRGAAGRRKHQGVRESLSLVGIVTLRCRELMDSTALVTGSQRVADAAARLGLGSPVILADSPDDAALTGALVRWRAGNP